MPLALGERLFFRHALGGGWLALALAAVAILLVRFWPAIVAWLERRRSR